MSEDNAVPPLGEGEFIHFEYLHFDPDDAETGFTNMVEVSHDRTTAGYKAAWLIADPKVWAIHIRRFEQPEQGVHLYDETQHLAVAQNKAYVAHKRAEVLGKLLGAAVESNHKLEDALDRETRLGEIYGEAKDAVIAELVRMLESIREVAVRDQRDAVYTEPADIARMTKVNVQALRESEVRKAKERAKLRKEQNLCSCEPVRKNADLTVSAEYLHAADCPVTEEDQAERACKKCGRPEMDHAQWAMGHLYERGEVVLDYCASVTMRAIPQATHSEHLFTTDDESGIVLDQRTCRIGLCMLTYGEAKEMGLTVTSSALSVLPTPAGGPQGTPDKPEDEQSPEDLCVCGHVRRVHQGDEGLGGAQCTRCSGDDERSWRHPFRLLEAL